MPLSRTLLPATLVTALALLPTACTGGGSAGNNDHRAAPPATAPDGAPVFPRPEDTAKAIKDARLEPLPHEAPEYHLHAHLDVIINGKAVAVPAGIGIVLNDKQEPTGYSPLHTHDTTGLIHVEAPEQKAFRVSQLFSEWGVKLDKTCIATFCADDKNQLLTRVNGEPVPDPTSVVLASHAEIVIWYGPKSDGNPKVPTTYEFPPGS